MHRTRRTAHSRGSASRSLRSLAAGIVSLAVAACASMTARTAADYERGSTPEAKFLDAAAGCAKEAEAHQKEFGHGDYDPNRGPYNRLYDACMHSQGYARKAQP
jgi:hypothetical protein